MNIHLILQMAVDAMAERIAISAGDRHLTFAELDAAARNVATKAQASERLAYLCENSPAMPAAIFGAALAGKPFVPINYRLAEDQIAALIARITPAVLITNQDKTYRDITTITTDAVLEGDAYAGDAPDVESSVAIELFTSGTTGEPKSALLRHANLLAYIFGSVEFMSASEDEASLISVPPYHIAGVSAVLSSSYAGRRMVQLPNFSAEKWIELARKETITHAFVVPTMLQHIVDYVADKAIDIELPTLRALSYGGGKMPLSVIERAMDMLPHVNFTNAYGLTETSSTICLLDPETHRQAKDADNPLIRRRLKSVGQPLPMVDVQIRKDDGTLCTADETGAVFVRADQVSGEYKNSGSLLDEDGWFPTKDIGFMDSEGFLFLDGRADDVIVRGGENISPGEIEDVLLTHTQIKDAAAIAVADEQWGEAIGVAIVCDGTPPAHEELCTLIRSKLRSSRVPSKIITVDALPYNETGKLLRRVVRDWFAEE